MTISMVLGFVADMLAKIRRSEFARWIAETKLIKTVSSNVAEPEWIEPAENGAMRLMATSPRRNDAQRCRKTSVVGE